MPVWVDSDHTNRITARWLFKRELQKYFPKVANLCDTENKIFDALVEFYSKAADIIKEKAVDVVDAYVDNALIVQDSNNTFSVPEIYINPSNERAFKYSVHEKYSDFNNFELDFAKEIDKYKKTWFRNPKQGCFEIPLLDKGGTNTFNPDFIIWDKRKIFAIDTKGDHLIAGDAPRKLFSVQKYFPEHSAPQTSLQDSFPMLLQERQEKSVSSPLQTFSRAPEDLYPDSQKRAEHVFFHRIYSPGSFRDPVQFPQDRWEQ